MKLPVSWLKKYIDVKLPPEKLAEALTMSGTAVERIEKKGPESILEIEVTTNRPDCLSMLGLAKEVSALTGKKVRSPRHSDPPKAEKNLKNEILRRCAPQDDKVSMPKIVVEAKKVCPKYTARVIENVQIKESPDEIKNFLDWSGVRAISNVVDATNFVLLEMGQPLHAFDLDKIKGGMVIVRYARKDEKFSALDGIEYKLDEKTLVIADAERPIAIAGVMGGKLTEVTSSTKNILLESAFFDPALVRQTSRKYKLFTESSYRFEREVDIEKVVQASARARDLILEWAGGREVSKILELDFSPKKKTSKVILRLERMKDVLGMEISSKRVMTILKDLGFSAVLLGKNKISVTAINSRRDIVQEEDLIEEILRIEGFDKVPTAIPVTRHTQDTPEDKKAVKVLELKNFLAGLGFNEILTYSFLSERSLFQSGFQDFNKAQKLRNPISADHEYLRPTLLPGMLQSVLYNVHRKVSSIRFFEIGNRYLDGKEETVLALSIYGEWESHWSRKSEASFFDLKGVAENILSFLKASSVEWKSGTALPGYDYLSSIEVNSVPFGIAGALSQQVLKNWDLPKDLFFMEWTLDSLFTETLSKKEFRVRPIPKFPVVRRDTAFMIDSTVSVKALEELMTQTAAPYVKEVRLFDEYKGKNIPAGKRSLAFSLAYQKDDGTFTEEEISAIQTRVGEALKNKYQVEFR